MKDSDPPVEPQPESAQLPAASRRSVFLRRAGLLAVGIAPFVFFLLLLPPETAEDARPPASTSPRTSIEQPLAFPFSDAPSPEPSDADTEDEGPPSPSPSVRPPATTVLSPAPPTTMPGPAPPAAPAPNRFGAPPAACSNGVDDDGDGGTDLSDPGCSSGGDQAESDNPECSDGLDDDGDGTVDSGDPGCVDARDRSEADDNVIPTDNLPSEPEEPDGGSGPNDPEDPVGLDGLPP